MTGIVSGSRLRKLHGWVLGLAVLGASAAPATEESGTAHVHAFDLPPSSYLGAETRAALERQRGWWAQTPRSTCPPLETAPLERLPEIRRCLAAEDQRGPLYQAMRARYAVNIATREFAGVATEVFTPAAGTAPRNRSRVLINLHGGGFLEGARSISHLESIPVAAVAGMRVISVDYRQAPEARFPAATEDVVAVYRVLLKTYRPGDIGIFGCSAGGLLTAETVAWLLKEHLPLPGAVGLFCMGASYVGRGDSSIIAHALDGTSPDEFAKYQQYFDAVRADDPLAYPVRSDTVMAAFPPTLLISATRDHALSSVIDTQAHLVAAGVTAELHVYEGLGHAFFYNPELPESRAVYAVVARFFDAHLGAPHAPRGPLIPGRAGDGA